jgi:hypothetical protein
LGAFQRLEDRLLLFLGEVVALVGDLHNEVRDLNLLIFFSELLLERKLDGNHIVSVIHYRPL